MFILLTGFCLWLGWTVQIVRERKAMTYQVRRNGGYVILQQHTLGPLDANDKEIIGSQLFDVIRDGQVSWVRRLLGDEFAKHIQVKQVAEVDSVKRVFPECDVRVERVYP